MFERAVAEFYDLHNRHIHSYNLKDEGNSDRVSFTDGRDNFFETVIPHSSKNPKGEYLDPLLRKLLDRKV